LRKSPKTARVLLSGGASGDCFALRGITRRRDASPGRDSSAERFCYNPGRRRGSKQITSGRITGRTLADTWRGIACRAGDASRLRVGHQKGRDGGVQAHQLIDRKRTLRMARPAGVALAGGRQAQRVHERPERARRDQRIKDRRRFAHREIRRRPDRHAHPDQRPAARSSWRASSPSLIRLRRHRRRAPRTARPDHATVPGTRHHRGSGRADQAPDAGPIIGCGRIRHAAWTWRPASRTSC